MGTPSLQKILYVDDDPSIRTIAQLSLEAVGKFQVQLCENGADAVSAARSFAPDLIMMDVMMPGMDGPATLRGLLSEPDLARIPVIFITAKAMPSEVAALRALGAVGVIGKPFDPMTLPETVREIWRQHFSPS